METKTCFKCGRELPLSEFYKHPQMADGHLNKCKECTRKDTRENRLKNIVYYKRYDRKRALNPDRVEYRKEYNTSERGREIAHETHRIYRMKNPEKRRAQAILYKAVKRGEIQKQCCEICGSANVQAHHSDYTKPLDVIWLCPKHHAWIHDRGGVR